MKFLEKLNPNSETKVYVVGAISTVITLFVVTAVVFLYILSSKLSIIMSQSAKESFTYFVAIMDRILALVTLFGFLPISFYQIFSKNKNKFDRLVTTFSVVLLVVLFGVFVGGECHYFQKYKLGELNNSQLFQTKTFEMTIFDKFIK
jgi:tetrahydromethanopterin S-methyltransferase subunit E